MSRAEKRRKAREIKKKVKDLSVSEFDGLISKDVGKAFDAGHEAGFEWALKLARNALSAEFGFGDKRLLRFIDAIEKMEG